MGMIRLPSDFKEFLKLLNASGAEYLVIGGYAVGYHGYPRATIDLDIWVGTETENAEKVVDAIKRFGFSDENLSKNSLTQADQIIRMGVPPMRLEILSTISGVDFGECFERRITDVLDDIEINVICLADLKQNKSASGRYQDLSDLENLP